jgi:hypothetical protein
MDTGPRVFDSTNYFLSVSVDQPPVKMHKVMDVDEDKLIDMVCPDAFKAEDLPRLIGVNGHGETL